MIHTLSDLSEQSLMDKELAGMSRYTIRNYTLNLRRLKDAVGQDRDVQHITIQEIKTLFQNLAFVMTMLGHVAGKLKH